MKRVCAAVVLLAAAPAYAVPLSCAQDQKTFRVMCVEKNGGVSANGEIRSARLWQGGPKDIQETNITARVHCGSRVLELTDRQGIAFARNRPPSALGRDFVDVMCEFPKPKHDPKLKTD